MINGKKYWYVTYFYPKYIANLMAKQMRNEGNYIRVVEDRPIEKEMKFDKGLKKNKPLYRLYCRRKT